MKFVAFFFLLLFVSATSYQVSLTILYTLQQDYISAVFCENKDDEAMQCNGKCHLKKTIAKTQNKQSEKNTFNILHIFLPAYMPTNVLSLDSHLSIRYTKLYHVAKFLKDSYQFSSLDPPKV